MGVRVGGVSAPLTAYHKYVANQGPLQFDDLKEHLLQALGYSEERCRKKFWSNTWNFSNGVHSVLDQLQSLADRLLKECKSVEDAKHKMLMGKLLSICPHDIAEHILLRNPKTILETANIIQDRLDTQPTWKKDRSIHYHHHSRERISNGHNDEKKPVPHLSETKSGESNKLPKHHSVARDSHFRGRPNEQNQLGGPVVCYNCGEPGHKRPNCPHKVNMVTTFNKVTLLSLEGAIGNHKCMLTLDSGAQITVVNKSLVTEDEYTGESIKLTGIGGYVTIAKLAVVKICTENFSFLQKVAVIPNNCQEVLIGMDVVHFKELWRLACKTEQARVSVNTRAQTLKMVDDESRDKVLSERDSAFPDSVDLAATEGKGSEVCDAVESESVKLTSQTAHADNDKSLDIDVIAKHVSDLESTE